MIVVEHDGFPAWMGGESCAFCRRSTFFWYKPKDVAVCQPCAETVSSEDVPSKREWLNSLGDNLPPSWVPNIEKKNGDRPPGRS